MNEKYKFRTAEKEDDAKALKSLFNPIFHPEKVGDLAETMFHHLPVLPQKNWLIMEEHSTAEMAAAFVMIPWRWNMEGLELKVMEQGIVGTAEKHRGQRLIGRLNREMDKRLEEEEVDLAVIQGIPGFYQNFGYRHSLPLEFHLNLELREISGEGSVDQIRQATAEDIPYLLEQDEVYRKSFSLSTMRDKAQWEYLLGHSKDTEYGSEFYILESPEGTYYIRLSLQGFGDGLIVSEISEDITPNAMGQFLLFLKELAEHRKKPYLRFNIHNESKPGIMLVLRGAHREENWCWQIKIPSLQRLLKKMKPLLEKRLGESSFKTFSGTLRVDYFKGSVDLVWQKGRITDVLSGEGETPNSICLSIELLPQLILGSHSLEEMLTLRPDIRFTSVESKQLQRILFPKKLSWLYCQY